MAEKDPKEYAKEMKPAQRVAYRWYYYKWFILIGVGLAILFVVMIVQIVRTPSSYLAEIVIVNGDTISVDDSDFFDDFITEYGYEEDVDFLNIDASFEIDLDDPDEEASANYQVIATMFLSGDIDIFISDKEIFELEAENNAFLDLSEILSEEMLEKYADQLVYYEDEETGESVAYGISLEDSRLYTEETIFAEAPVAAVGSQSSDTDVDTQMIEYLLEH